MQEERFIYEWAQVQSDVRQVCHAYCHAYRCSADVDELLTDVFVTAYRHYDPEQGSLLPFCNHVAKQAIFSQLRAHAKGGNNNGVNSISIP